MKAKKPITKEINGDIITFYPLPVGVLLKCRVLSESVSSLVANLFADTANDIETEETTMPVKLGESADEVYMNREYVRKPIQPSMASLRINQKKEGIQALLDTMTEQGTMEIFAEMICKSAKDESLTNDKVLHELDLETVIEAFKGVLDANKGIFDQLGKLFPRLNLEKAGEALEAKVKETMN